MPCPHHGPQPLSSSFRFLDVALEIIQVKEKMICLVRNLKYVPQIVKSSQNEQIYSGEEQGCLACVDCSQFQGRENKPGCSVTVWIRMKY